MFLNKSPRPDRNLPGTIGKFFMGIAIGILSALVGAGGGFISVPWMIWCNVKMQNAVATSAAFGFPIALFGTIGYIISGWNVSGLPPWPIDLGYICIPALFSVVDYQCAVCTARSKSRSLYRHKTAQEDLCLPAVLRLPLHDQTSLFGDVI